MDNNNNGQESIPLEEWYCWGCLKLASASRPPILNSVNCSCSERGELAGGHCGANLSDQPVTTSAPYDHTTTGPQFEVAPLNFTTGHVPPSNDSTNLQDVPCQEGIENHRPELQVEFRANNDPKTGPTHGMNNFLEVNGYPTDNEKIARRSFSFHSQYPHTLQRYINTQETTFSNVLSPPLLNSQEPYYTLPTGFVEQGMQFGSPSMLVGGRSSKQSKQSKQSQMSSREGNPGEQSWLVFQVVDPTMCVGTWIDGDGDVYECGEGMYASDLDLLKELDEGW